MIKDNVPSFVAEMGGIKELFSAEQPETDALEGAAEDMLKEFRGASFTEKTAAYWEKLCGLEPADAWPIERRRERVRAAMCVPSCMTPNVLKEIIEYTGGVETEVFEDADAYTVKVRFVGEKGIPVYLDDILKAIERIRPFHVKVEKEFTWAKLEEIEGALESAAAASLAEIAVM